MVDYPCENSLITFRAICEYDLPEVDLCARYPCPTSETCRSLFPNRTCDGTCSGLPACSNGTSTISQMPINITQNVSLTNLTVTGSSNVQVTPGVTLVLDGSLVVSNSSTFTVNSSRIIIGGDLKLQNSSLVTSSEAEIVVSGCPTVSSTNLTFVLSTPPSALWANVRPFNE